MASNRAAIREAQRKNRERAAVEAQQDEEHFKLRQFDAAPSRVRRDLQRREEENKAKGNSPEDAKFLRAHQREDKLDEQALQAKQRTQQRERAPRKSSLPAEVSKPRDAETREARNFQKENARKVITSKPVNVQKGGAAKPTKDFGKVPKYLRERQAELAQEEDIRRQLADIDMDCPEGMRLLPEGERIETLKILEGNREKVTAEIGQMPFVIDTLGLKKRKQALENKLKDIDNAIKIFSRRKVYVET